MQEGVLFSLIRLRWHKRSGLFAYGPPAPEASAAMEALGTPEARSRAKMTAGDVHGFNLTPTYFLRGHDAPSRITSLKMTSPAAHRYLAEVSLPSEPWGTRVVLRRSGLKTALVSP